MERLTITRDEAARVMREAHAAGRLAAQSRDPQAVYINAVDGNRCAIGVLFTPEQARAFEYEWKDYPVARCLIDAYRLIVDDPEWFIKAQNLHDAWASARRRCCGAAVREADFLEHIKP